jgi:signal transduction histidine kinase
LTGIKLNIEVLEDDIPPTSKKLLKKLKDIKRQIDVMITEIRRISSNLRPTALDDFGLVVALQLLCKQFQEVHNFKIKFQPSVRERYDDHVEIAIYRIAQEALSNIAKHAEAASACMQLSDRGNAIVLTIQDDGKGFEVEKVRRQKGPGCGLGLISMRERAEMLGGSFRIESSLKSGATIHVVIPIPSSKAHEENQDPDR